MKYRISKYNPSCRDGLGRYTVNEWSSLYDIGKTFNGVQFTLEEYLKVENNYITTYISLLKYFNTDTLEVVNLENSFTIDEVTQNIKKYQFNLSSGEWDIFSEICDEYLVTIDKFKYIFKLIMREIFWCSLRDKNSNLLIEFGYDYYTYITCGNISNEIIDTAKQNNIFVEPYF